MHLLRVIPFGYQSYLVCTNYSGYLKDKVFEVETQEECDLDQAFTYQKAQKVHESNEQVEKVITQDESFGTD